MRFALVIPWCCLALGACDKGKSGIAPSPSASASAQPSASVSVAAASATVSGPQVRVQYDPALLMVHSAQGLDLAQAQIEAVDKLEKQLDQRPETAQDIRDMNDELVAGTKAGKIDAPKFDPRIVSIQKLIQTRLDTGAAALNTLFTTIDLAQKKTLVADIRAQHDTRPSARDGGLDDPAKRRVDRVAKELDLDATQRGKVQAILASAPPVDSSDRQTEMDALLAAFVAEAFDAKKLEPFKSGAARVKVRFEREVKFLSQLAPVLTPEQRDVLAARLQQSPMMRGGPPQSWPFPFEEEPGSRAAWDFPTRQKPPRR
jgi:Spy/CpxP family protein refolding chaperone